MIKICFGIPFKASNDTKALELCVMSIEKFCTFDKEIYILLDITNAELAKSFQEHTIRCLSEKIRFKYYTREKSGDHKQALLNWIIEETSADYSIILHSDVFFFNKNAFDILITPLYKCDDFAFACWKIPFVRYESTFHISEKVAHKFNVAPRISSWLFSFNVKKIKTVPQVGEILLGHYWIRNGIIPELPIERPLFINWLYKENDEAHIDFFTEDILIDIGTFWRCLWDAGYFKGLCLGELDNPSFKSMDFLYHKEGFVHIEQYDPERFNNSLYSRELFLTRTEMVEAVKKQLFCN